MVDVNLPGVAFHASMQVDVDTTPGGNFLRISGTGLSLTIAGQSLTNAAISFERSLVNGVPVVKVALSGADLSFGSFLTIADASGELVIASDGIAGRLSATATLDAEGLLDGSFSVGIEVNTRPAAVSETFLVGGVQKTLSLPAGPFLRVEVIVPEATPLSIAAGARQDRRQLLLPAPGQRDDHRRRRPQGVGRRQRRAAAQGRRGRLRPAHGRRPAEDGLRGLRDREGRPQHRRGRASAATSCCASTRSGRASTRPSRSAAATSSCPSARARPTSSRSRSPARRSTSPTSSPSTATSPSRRRASAGRSAASRSSPAAG